MMINKYYLPILDGTEKQTAWASDIRTAMVSAFESWLDEQGRMVERAVELAPQHAEVILDAQAKVIANVKHLFQTKNRASFWINEKDTPVYRILNTYGVKCWANMNY
tara:strand:+ start:145 stop:465 length:321 start_codon:yes stop_codon:yes gene_type:complete